MFTFAWFEKRMRTSEIGETGKKLKEKCVNASRNHFSIPFHLNLYQVKKQNKIVWIISFLSILIFFIFWNEQIFIDNSRRAIIIIVSGFCCTRHYLFFWFQNNLNFTAWNVQLDERISSNINENPSMNWSAFWNWLDVIFSTLKWRYHTLLFLTIKLLWNFSRCLSFPTSFVIYLITLEIVKRRQANRKTAKSNLRTAKKIAKWMVFYGFQVTYLFTNIQISTCT